LTESKANNPDIKYDKSEYDRISFSGEWEEDAKVKGVIIYRNKDEYEGQLYDDKHHGIGILTDGHGDIYIGGWQKGEKHGLSDLYCDDDDSLLKCLYSNGKCNGIGLSWDTNGDIYQMTLKDDEPCGILLMDTTS
jgi:hypothetical protein